MRIITKEWVSGNIYIRQNEVTGNGPDDVVHGHKHNFDHTTFFHRGTWHVEAILPDGSRREGRFAPPGNAEGLPSHCLIRAEVMHEIRCESEGGGIFQCVYSHNTPQGTISQVYDGWAEAYH